MCGAAAVTAVAVAGMLLGPLWEEPCGCSWGAGVPLGPPRDPYGWDAAAGTPVPVVLLDGSCRSMFILDALLPEAPAHIMQRTGIS